MSRYIPQPAYPDMMPVDISFVFADEKPAGKHGFVKADGDDFRFADGTLARFWGVNFNGGANFPEHDYAKKVARRLAMAGVNMVRFHQLDAEWDTPNLFAYNKGKRVRSTRQFDETSMDRLDYLIYALKEEGIYCYLDMLTYRHFKEDDGVKDYEIMGDKARPWCITNPYLIELQKEFCTMIWNHVNPYTGLAYKDDPVIAMSEIVNECDLFMDADGKKADHVRSSYYENEFRQQFKAWLDKKGIADYDWEDCDLYRNDDIQLQFKIDATQAYYRAIRDHMREIGVKVPITGSNWTKCNAHVKAQEEMDYTDSHHYYYDWKWGNTERTCAHRSITSSPQVFAGMSHMKVANKPFFVSEWDMPWPNSFRAEGVIYYAAVGALQGWGGFTIHTYAYGTRLEDMKVLGREQSSPVGGIPYREGIFSTWNDPAKFGLFYHAALMLRRCDITPAKKKVAVKTEISKTLYNQAATTGLEQVRIATVFDDKLPEGYDEVHAEKEAFSLADPGMIVSDNGEMWRDLKKRVGAIDTPRTKIAYGFLSRGGAQASVVKTVKEGVQLNGVAIECKTDFGVIAMSSLTDDPIEKSDNILISAIGRARNTGAQFDGEKMIDIGHPPIMAEVVSARITMKTDKPKALKVWGVNAEGYYAGKCLTTDNGDGTISFEIGDEMNPACYYLIVAD